MLKKAQIGCWRDWPQWEHWFKLPLVLPWHARNFLLVFKEPLFLAHRKMSFAIKTRFSSNVIADLRLPDQISARVKLNKADRAAPICNCELNLIFRRQVAVNCNNYRTVSCSNYWKLNYQIRNACNWNRKQLQNFVLSVSSSCYWKNSGCVLWKKMTTVTNYEQIMLMIEVVQKRAQFTFIFDGNGPHAWKILWAPCRHHNYTNTFDWKYKFE